jgi:hypothetical protein
MATDVAGRAIGSLDHRESNRVSRVEPNLTFGRRIGFGPALVALTAIGFALRATRLGHQSFWIDEVLTFGWIGAIDRHGLGALSNNIHGPLFAATVWLASRISTAEAWLRLPSLLAGTAAVPALGLLGRSLFGSGIGLAAAALLCLSPFALYYSQECRNYSFTILLAIAVLAAARAMLQRPGWRRAAWLAVAEMGSILSNLNGFFFVIGVGAWGLWTLRRERRALGMWVAAHALAAACLLPYAWGVTHQVRPERLVGVETGFGSDTPLRGPTTLHVLAVPYTAFAFAAGYSLGPTLAELRSAPSSAVAPRHWPALVLVVVGFGVPFVLGLARRWRDCGLLIVPALVVIGFTVWLAATNMKPYNVRYLSVTLPAFLLLVALGFAELRQRWRWLAAAAALVASVWSCANYLFVPRYGRDDVRGAVAYVASRARPEDAVLQLSLTAMLEKYYTQLAPRPVHPPGVAATDPAAARQFVRGLVSPGGTLWYLECRPEALDPSGVLRQSLYDLAPGPEITDFVGVRVYRFSLPQSFQTPPSGS